MMLPGPFLSQTILDLGPLGKGTDTVDQLNRGVLPFHIGVHVVVTGSQKVSTRSPKTSNS
jgi:hypothetical protein